MLRPEVCDAIEDARERKHEVELRELRDTDWGQGDVEEAEALRECIEIAEVGARDEPVPRGARQRGLRGVDARPPYRRRRQLDLEYALPPLVVAVRRDG